MKIKNRFRGFLPVVIDVETSGFDCNKNAILEIAAVAIKLNSEENVFTAGQAIHYHVQPFDGAEMVKEALEFNQIQPDHPFRFAEDEKHVFTNINEKINKLLVENRCKKAILVGHNAHFDLGFVNAAYQRTNITSVFHSFSVLDTATLAALAFGETVLAKAMYKAKINFNTEEAHSALYDTEKTAELFCHIFNTYKKI